MLAVMTFAACTNTNEQMNNCVNDTWDKVFPLSEKVNHKKVSFKTQYGFTLVGDLYTPKANDKSQITNHKSQIRRFSGVRSFRRNQRAEFGSICDENGGARVCSVGF